MNDTVLWSPGPGTFLDQESGFTGSHRQSERSLQDELKLTLNSSTLLLLSNIRHMGGVKQLKESLDEDFAALHHPRVTSC